MKIYMVQMNVAQGNPALNFQTIQENVKKAEALGASLVVFPAFCISGTFLGGLWSEKSFVKECLLIKEQIFKLSEKVDILFGHIGEQIGQGVPSSEIFYASQGEFVPLKFSNSIAIVSPNKKDVFAITNSQAESTLQEAGELLSQRLEENKFLVSLSALPFESRKRETLYDSFKKVSSEHKVSLLYVNAAGVVNEAKNIYALEGASSYFQKGTQVFKLKTFTSDNKFFDLDSTLEVQISEPEKSSIEEIREALVYMIQESLKRFGVHRVVIGASGGIDSAVSAALYAEAIGPNNVYLVNMPTKFNSETTKNAARDLAKNLGCPYAVVPISDMLDSMQNTLSKTCFEGQSQNLSVAGIHFENLQARTRSASVLASVASVINGAFTCNGNKTEAMVGYCTLYGDTSGIFCVLGDLWKTQVYALAEEINKEKEIIPQASIDIPASAELSEAQNVDEGKGDPIIYPYHDKLFAYWMEGRNSLLDSEEALKNGTLLDSLGVSPEYFNHLFKSEEMALTDMRQWWKRYKGIACAKRIQMPPILSVSKRPFGGPSVESQI